MSVNTASRSYFPSRQELFPQLGGWLGGHHLQIWIDKLIDKPFAPILSQMEVGMNCLIIL